MTRRLIFMNEHIREAEPSKPVIVVQTGDEQCLTNRVQLVCGGKVVAQVVFIQGGLKAVKTHNVRAYVELFGDVEVALL